MRAARNVGFGEVSSRSVTHSLCTVRAKVDVGQLRSHRDSILCQFFSFASFQFVGAENKRPLNTEKEPVRLSTQLAIDRQSLTIQNAILKR
jgi:hypothetical protein